MFVSELPNELLEFESAKRIYSRHPVRNQPIRRPMEFEDYSQEIPDYSGGCGFDIGSWVRHPTYGKGKVTACSGNGDKTTVTIIFGSIKKKINVKHGKLVPA